LTTIAVSLYTNRALCYSKERRDANVIADTTYVIKNLSKRNLKAYYRRALAYKNFGQNKEALADLEIVLDIEPKNTNGKKEHKIIKELYEKELTKQFEKSSKIGSTTEPKTKPKVEEVDSSYISRKAQNNSSKAAPTPEPKKRVKYPNDTIEKAAKLAAENIGKEEVRIPSTSYGFEADVNSYKKNYEELYRYISAMPVSLFSKIYKNVDIQADYMIIILSALDKHETDNDKLLKILYDFSLTQNITMTTMFFNDSDRKLLENLLEKAASSSLDNKETLLKKAKSMLE